MSQPATHYRKPGWLTRQVFNRVVAGLTKAGISMRGSRVLEVRGRQSGEARRTPVNPLELGGHMYLVSPRGNSQWVRNVRADGGRLVLILGGRRDERIAREIADVDKPPILREYLRRWKAEVGQFFEGVGSDPSDEDLARIAPKHPVFVLDDKSG